MHGDVRLQGPGPLVVADKPGYRFAKQGIGQDDDHHRRSAAWYDRDHDAQPNDISMYYMWSAPSTVRPRGTSTTTKPWARRVHGCRAPRVPDAAALAAAAVAAAAAAAAAAVAAATAHRAGAVRRPDHRLPERRGGCASRCPRPRRRFFHAHHNPFDNGNPITDGTDFYRTHDPSLEEVGLCVLAGGHAADRHAGGRGAQIEATCSGPAIDDSVRRTCATASSARPRRRRRHRAGRRRQRRRRVPHPRGLRGGRDGLGYTLGGGGYFFAGSYTKGCYTAPRAPCQRRLLWNVRAKSAPPHSCNRSPAGAHRVPRLAVAAAVAAAAEPAARHVPHPQPPPPSPPPRAMFPGQRPASTQRWPSPTRRTSRSAARGPKRRASRSSRITIGQGPYIIKPGELAFAYYPSLGRHERDRLVGRVDQWRLDVECDRKDTDGNQICVATAAAAVDAAARKPAALRLDVATCTDFTTHDDATALRRIVRTRAVPRAHRDHDDDAHGVRRFDSVGRSS